MTTEAECPECAHVLKCWHEGSSAICKCPNCGWEVVTTYLPPIRRDETNYEVFIRQNLSPEPIHYKTLSRLTGKNYIEIRKLLSDKEFVLFEGRATKVLPIKEQLEKGGIEFRIAPDFEY